jgi:glycine/D-amino acid oxidase-like deaminating enzyme
VGYNPRVAIAILGAGLQGACIALELAHRGVPVDLVDQDALPLNRASLRNEGKVHLGFVYAKDESLRTARLMVRGALAFRRLLARWTRGDLERLTLSAPFRYLVPHDSALSPDALAAHYAAVERLYDEGRRDGGDYLGGAPDPVWRRLGPAEIGPFAATEGLQAGFSTAEASVDLRVTAAALRCALASTPSVRLHLGRRVRAVTRGAAGFRVEGEALDGASWRLDAEQVVNALWDGRLVIDRGLGLEPPRPWVHRLKYRVMVTLPEALRGMPSLSFVLGAYGDVGVYGDGEGYVSWYPECLRGWSRELAPPAAWTPACTGRLEAAEQAEVGRRVLAAFDALVPGLARARIRAVDAGVIFSWGESDITDPGSALHRRDDTGVTSRDGYHSVNTGKLTTAPLFAVETADRVEGRAPTSRGA